MDDSIDKTQSPSLRDALEKHGGTNQSIAQGAGVSNRAVVEARNGIAPGDFESARKRQGVAGSFTRLAVFLGLNPTDVLSELGLDPENPGVRTQVRRARSDALSTDPTDDPTLRRVVARQDERPRVGIVDWTPFTTDAEGWTFAKALLRSLLGSLDLSWAEVDGVPMGFTEVQDRLFEDIDEPNSLEMGWGVYKLPSRHTDGVDVVPIPGLAMPLGGLWVGVEKPGSEKITWSEVISVERHVPHVLVVSHDAGEIFMKGPVGFPSRLLLDPDQRSRDPEQIVDRIMLELEERRELLFVADGPLVVDVWDYLKNQRVDLETYRLKNDRWAPCYEFGMGIRSDSERLRDLILESLNEDVFGRALPRTVAAFHRLLEVANDERSPVDFSFPRLEAFQSGLARRFWNAADDLGLGAVFERADEEGHQKMVGGE